MPQQHRRRAPAALLSTPFCAVPRSGRVPAPYVPSAPLGPHPALHHAPFCTALDWAIRYPGEVRKPLDPLSTHICHQDEEPGWEVG